MKNEIEIYAFLGVEMTGGKRKTIVFSDVWQIWDFMVLLLEKSECKTDDADVNYAAIRYMSALSALLLAYAPEEERNSDALIDFLTATNAQIEMDPVNKVFEDYKREAANCILTQEEEAFWLFACIMYREFSKITEDEKNEAIAICQQMICNLISPYSEFNHKYELE